MKSSQITAVIIAVLSLAWIGSGFFLPHKAATAQGLEQQDEKPLIEVRTRLLTAQPYPDIVHVTGRTQASKTVSLRAETNGQVQAVSREEGQSIAQNDVLAELEVRDRKARVAEARQRVEQREIEYNAAKNLAGKGFNSKVRLAQAEADLENAKAALKDAQVDLGKVQITSPLDGVIFRQSIEAGDYVASGDALFTIVDLDPIELVGFVSERRIQDLKIGGGAQAAFLNGQMLEGEISYIAPAADPESRTFRILISAANADYTIKDGLTARLMIPVGEKKAHKISPSILTLDEEGRVGVKAVNDQNIVEFHPVTILSDTADAMWVSGLAEQLKFITVGQDFVTPGQLVKPVAASGEGLL